MNTLISSSRTFLANAVLVLVISIIARSRKNVSARGSPVIETLKPISPKNIARIEGSTLASETPSSSNGNTVSVSARSCGVIYASPGIGVVRVFSEIKIPCTAFSVSPLS